MPEVAFIDTDDDRILSEELSNQPADPDPLRVVLAVSVLDVRLVMFLNLRLNCSFMIFLRVTIDGT